MTERLRYHYDDDAYDDDDSDNNLHVDCHIVDGLPNERISDWIW